MHLKATLVVLLVALLLAAALSAAKRPRFRANVYAHVNLVRSSEHWDYESLHINWGQFDDYRKGDMLGEGEYGTAYRGVNVKTGQQVVVKQLQPREKIWIKREIKVMQALEGGPDIIKMYDVVKEPETKAVHLVFEYVNNTYYKDLYPTFTAEDIRYYFYHMVKGIDYAHSQGIMHRDVKPHNVVIDHAQRYLRVIDWGFADFYHPDDEYTMYVASRFWKAPEIMVNHYKYDYAVDMWSLGTVLGGMLFNVNRLFDADSEDDMIVEVAKTLGTDELWAYLDKYDLELNEDMRKALRYRPKAPWSSYITDRNRERVTPESLDLLAMLLRWDPQERITSHDALRHPYFAPVRTAEAAGARHMR